MRKTLAILFGCAALSASGINVTNYLVIHSVSNGQYILISDFLHGTNYNLSAEEAFPLLAALNTNPVTMGAPLKTTSHMLLYTDPTDLYAAMLITNEWGRVYMGDAVTPMAMELTDGSGAVIGSMSYGGVFSMPSFLGGEFAVSTSSGITSAGVHYGNGSGLTNAAPALFPATNAPSPGDTI